MVLIEMDDVLEEIMAVSRVEALFKEEEEESRAPCQEASSRQVERSQQQRQQRPQQPLAR